MRVSRATAFWCVGYAFYVTMLGATLPTPLYPIYGRDFGISAMIVTIIFAAYALGVMTGLILFGKLSDSLGRRPVLLPGLLLSMASAVVFLLANDTALLYVGRVLSGLSAGIFTGTATATLIDLAPGGRRMFASAVAVVVNVGGLGSGSLLSGLLAEVAPLPTRLAYAVDLALLLPAVLLILLIPETARGRPDAPRLRLQRLRVPPEVSGLFARAALVGFCAFAVSGLYGAVAPTFLAQLLGLPNHALAGAVIFLLMGSSAGGQLMTARMSQRVAFTTGCAGLVVGLAALAAGLLAGALAGLLLSALLVGVGQGLVIGSGLAAINTRVSAERRGEAASTYFTVLYVGLALPVIGDGILGSVTGIRTAALVFTGAVAAVVIAVLLSLARRKQVEAVWA